MKIWVEEHCRAFVGGENAEVSLLAVISSVGFLNQTADYLNSPKNMPMACFFACVLCGYIGERIYPAASQFLWPTPVLQSQQLTLKRDIWSLFKMNVMHGMLKHRWKKNLFHEWAVVLKGLFNFYLFILPWVQAGLHLVVLYYLEHLVVLEVPINKRGAQVKVPV